MIKKVVTLYFLVALFSSCNISMSKKEQKENILSAPFIEKSTQEAFHSSFVRADWPDKTWWQAYGYEELNTLILEALEKNPTIQGMRARIDFAKQNAIIARSKLFPLLYFDASDQWQYLSENGLYRALNPGIKLNNQQIDFSLSFSYEFDFWGKYHNLFYSALNKAKAAAAETAFVELITEVALAKTYFALKTNLVRANLYEKLYQVRKNYYELQRSLSDNAIDSALYFLLSEEAVFESRQLVLAIEEEILVNKHTINILAGCGPDDPLDVEEPLLPLPKKLSLPDNISFELLSRRPDLMSNLFRVEALAHEVGAARADFWPNVNLAAIVGLQSGSWGNLFEWASRTIGALPGLSLPLYTAGAIGANAGAKKALFDEAVYQYNDLILKSFQEVSDLIAIGNSVYKQKKQQEKIVVNAKERLELTRLSQVNGIVSDLSLYLIEEEKIQKELEDVALLYSQYVVNLGLIKALGGGYISGGSNGS